MKIGKNILYTDFTDDTDFKKVYPCESVKSVLSVYK
jgi:hypothetical protein